MWAGGHWPTQQCPGPGYAAVLLIEFMGSPMQQQPENTGRTSARSQCKWRSVPLLGARCTPTAYHAIRLRARPSHAPGWPMVATMADRFVQGISCKEIGGEDRWQWVRLLAEHCSTAVGSPGALLLCMRRRVMLLARNAELWPELSHPMGCHAQPPVALCTGMHT